MTFTGTVIASFLAFVGAIVLMAVGLFFGSQRIRRGCGNPEDCHCGASQRHRPPNDINGTASE